MRDTTRRQVDGGWAQAATSALELGRRQSGQAGKGGNASGARQAEGAGGARTRRSGVLSCLRGVKRTFLHTAALSKAKRERGEKKAEPCSQTRSRGARARSRARPRSHAVSAFPQPAGALATCSLPQPAHGWALQPTADRPHARRCPPSRADGHHEVGSVRHCRAGDRDAARPGVGALRGRRRAQRAARQAPQAPAEGGVPPLQKPSRHRSSEATSPHTAPHAKPPHTAPEEPALSLRVTHGLEWRALSAALGAGMP